MKQPDLGKKIAELRKSKGLTQEELVEKCNVSVRTIQRIESGEVIPRNSTIRILFAALDYTITDFKDHANETAIERVFSTISEKLETLFLTREELENNIPFMKRQIQIAWIAGLVSFFIGFIEAGADHLRDNTTTLTFNRWLYICIKVVAFISYLYFQRGFIALGILFKNYLLKIVSYLLIIIVFFIIFYDIVSVFYYPAEREFIKGAEALTFGAISIVFGISLLRLQDSMGKLSKYAGVFEIISGCFFITLILWFIGAFLLIPAEIFEIIILFKACEFLVKDQTPA